VALVMEYEGMAYTADIRGLPSRSTPGSLEMEEAGGLLIPIHCSLTESTAPACPTKTNVRPVQQRKEHFLEVHKEEYQGMRIAATR
jgi:hypothetical protein